MARSVVPPPISATITPSSFSVSVSVASAAASELITSSSIWTLALAMHLDRFWIEVAAPAAMGGSPSSRTPLLPRDDVAAREDVEDLRVGGHLDRLDGLGGARHVFVAHLALVARYGHHA